MAWLQRLFGMETPENAEVNPTPETEDTEEEIPAERLGLNGEYDESGLAKRVALAFDEDPELADIDRLWVAQLTGTVVLKGEVPSQDILDKMVDVASSINGATDVNTDEVTILEGS
jgi:osmotically-inducible protein OsmY